MCSVSKWKLMRVIKFIKTVKSKTFFCLENAKKNMSKSISSLANILIMLTKSSQMEVAFLFSTARFLLNSVWLKKEEILLDISIGLQSNHGFRD